MSVQRLPGAIPFSLPEVIKELELTDTQQEQIHQLVQRTVATIREVSARWQKSGRQKISQQRAQVLTAARREALEMLTEEQRARWMELSE